MTRLTTTLLITVSLISQIAMAGLPPTTTKSQLDSAKSTTFDFQAPFNQFTKPNGTTALIETGNKNLLKDPGFESSDPTAVWVISGAGTVGRTSTAADVGSGSYALSYDAAATNGTVTSAAVAIPNGFIGKTLEASCDIKNTSAGLYKIQAYDGTNVLSEQLITTDSTYYVRNTLRFPSPTSGSISIRFLSGTAGEPVFYVDDCYLGIDRGQGSTQLISEWKSYTTTLSWTSGVGSYAAKSRRVGDSEEMFIYVPITGTPTTATFTFTPPSTCVVDTAKLAAGTITNLESLGTATLFDASASTRYLGGVTMGSTTSTFRVITDVSTSQVTQAVPFTWANGDFLEIHATAPCVGYAAQTTASIDAISKRGSAYFATGNATTTSGSAVAFNNASFSSPTLEGQALAPTTANDVGIRMTGAPAGVYEVNAVGWFYAYRASGETGTNCAYDLYDGTNSRGGAIAGAPNVSGVSTLDGISTLSGTFTLSSAGTINIVLRGQRTSGTGACYVDGPISISIKNVSQPGPSMVLPLSVSSALSNGAKIVTARVQALNGSTCTVSEEDGSGTAYDWLGSTTPIAAGRCTVAINAGVFSATPKCFIEPIATTYTVATQSLASHFSALSTTSMTLELRYDTGGSNPISGDDSPMMVMCFGAR